jgi:hypothetical protein
MYPQDKCYNVEVTFAADDSGSGWGTPNERACTCPMGESDVVCKHIAALLYVIAGGVSEGKQAATAVGASTRTDAGGGSRATAATVLSAPSRSSGKRSLSFLSKAPTKSATGKKRATAAERQTESATMDWAKAFVAEKGPSAQPHTASEKRTRDPPASSVPLSGVARGGAPAKRAHVESLAANSDTLPSAALETAAAPLPKSTVADQSKLPPPPPKTKLDVVIDFFT